jgi:hypothetical protein
LKDSLHLLDVSSCYCNSCHWSLVHQALHVPPEKEIQWSQFSRARGTGYWTPTPNPSVAKGLI